MIAMTDVRSRLRRASEQVTPPGQAFERMVERRERKRRTARAASAAVALALVLVFVGGSVALLSGLARDRARPASGPGMVDSPSPEEAVGANGDPEYDEARIAEENKKVREYMSCMRDRGWTLPDPEPWEGPPHPGLLQPPTQVIPDDPDRAKRFFRDSDACGVSYGDREPSAKYDEARIAEENRKVRAYMSCMRERGWTLPEPEVWEGPPHPGLLEPPRAVSSGSEGSDQYYRDSAECGVSYYDESGNLLPAGG